MNLSRKHAIGLLAALLVIAFFSVALVVHPLSLKALFTLGTSLSFAFGTVTVSYLNPLSVQGTAVGPTAAQINNPPLNAVVAQVNLSDTDTVFTITHNFGNPAYGATDSGRGFPYPIVFYTGAGTGPVVFQALPSSTTVVFTKSSAAGSGGTLEVVILRPSTNSR
jgi:hypothetical protein